ncbi:hypothetical protein L0Y47_04305 [Ectopseudomonas composti]|uniref:Uncharacterized protein n=1 Tax=Ectopseudomonas composti TaxID=658457 RepID=A0A1I5JE12_9GAMM|nr:hypothetical protein [Pseudomonas composti]MDN5515894.1 hypothetical protein [Pseudomonas sp.]SFO70591.1 hypothetical protein SAMN05216601_101255 [Pseudomonas composti]
MFLFFDFFSRAFNFDAKAVESRDARREAQRIQARRQRRQEAEAACRVH